MIRSPHGISVLLVAKGCLTLLVALGLSACSKEDENAKSLESGALNPPWDSPTFTPKELPGYLYEGPDSLFFVFQVIGMIDSLGGPRSTWTLEDEPATNVAIHQMFDTGFVFPRTPLATRPYAYDDSYRDDTLYRNAYGNGLFTQDHPCAATYVLTDPFLHPARWLKAGLKESEITEALGNPAFRSRGVLRYFSRRAPEIPGEGESAAAGRSEYDIHDVYEGINFYFRKDSLFAAVLHRSQPCH
jgi:hypothetical protein